MARFTDAQLARADIVEGQTSDRSQTDLGRLEQQVDAFNDARREAMKKPDYHPALFNRSYRGITS